MWKNNSGFPYLSKTLKIDSMALVAVLYVLYFYSTENCLLRPTEVDSLNLSQTRISVLKKKKKIYLISGLMSLYLLHTQTQTADLLAAYFQTADLFAHSSASPQRVFPEYTLLYHVYMIWFVGKQLKNRCYNLANYMI